MDTTLISSAANQKEQDAFRTISRTALLTGTLNIVAAITHNYIQTGTGPEHMLKSIASGIFGKDAFNGRTLMITWGLVFHFMIAFLFTAFLFLIYPKVLKWLKNKFIVGFIYGLLTWAVINLLVVPLSKINKFPPDTEQAIINAMIVAFTIGIPASLLAHRHYSRKRAT